MPWESHLSQPEGHQKWAEVSVFHCQLKGAGGDGVAKQPCCSGGLQLSVVDAGRHPNEQLLGGLSAPSLHEVTA